MGHGPMVKFNPHIKFFDGDRRGFGGMREACCQAPPSDDSTATVGSA